MVTMFANFARENTRPAGGAVGFPWDSLLSKTFGELVALFQ